MANPLFGVAIQALTAEARRVGYNVILANADGDPGQAIGLTEMLETRHCDALIMIGSLPNEAAMLADLASGKHPPTLSLFQGSEPLGVPAINVDNRLGTCLALTHLKELGHHAIAFVGTEEDRGLAERAAEYERFMADNHLPVPPGYRVTVATDQPPGDDFRALLNLPVPPTAVFAATDVLAFRVISVLSAQGVSVPGDVSVVGFDDITLAAIAAPPLTTVRQPLDSMAAQAVRDAIRMANDRSFRPPSLNLFQPELVIRKSCMPPARE
jgi:DNA-binding LacI/PurR family transcriptional regulator